MSRSAVSGEHLAIAAHLLLVSLPSKPSSSLFSNFTCRSFSGVVAQCCQVEVPVQPVFGLPDVFVIAAIHAEIMGRVLRTRKTFSAQSAVNKGAIRRMEGCPAQE